MNTIQSHCWNKCCDGLNVAIIGGGIAGITTAITLANAGATITIFEKNTFLSGTSDRTPGRMGLGFHYLGQSKTSNRYLKSTINFAKQYNNFTISETFSDMAYLKTSWYFLVANSFLSLGGTFDALEKLKKSYSDLVTQDPTNEIYGKPEDFYQWLCISEYESLVNKDIVQLGIKTQEKLLDWPRFKQYLLAQLHANSSIVPLEYVEICSVEKNISANTYRMITDAKQFKNNINNYDFVINATWENIEALDYCSGLKDCINKNETNRLKLLAEVRLPEELLFAPSMFFCLGPFCMFSNMAQGIGRITYAPITNYGVSNIVPLNTELRSILDDPFLMQKKKFFDLGQKIIEGVSYYIPAMKKATLLNVYPGIVKSLGGVDIYDKNSDFHCRDYSGVTQRSERWIDNACMKFFYCVDNAQEVLNIIIKQLQHERQL